MHIENPKHKQGDGAGFGRLRAAQRQRATFQRLILRSHPSANVYIDKVYEYAGAQIALYRLEGTFIPTARLAVFVEQDGEWQKVNDIIVKTEN